jgi:hypothetical protein
VLLLGELHHHLPQHDRGRALLETQLRELGVGVVGRGAHRGEHDGQDEGRALLLLAIKACVDQSTREIGEM